MSKSVIFFEGHSGHYGQIGQGVAGGMFKSVIFFEGSGVVRFVGG